MTAISSHLFRHSALVERKSVTVGSTGQAVKTWATVAAAVPCRLEARSNESRRSREGQVRLGDWILYVAGDADLLLNDRITISSTEYDLVDIIDAGGQSDHWEVGLDLHQGA